MANTKTNNKLTYVALGISIVALIVAIYGLFPPKKHFGPMHGFNPHHIEQRGDFNDRPNVRHHGQPNARHNAKPGFRPDAKRPTPTAPQHGQPTQPKAE